MKLLRKVLHSLVVAGAVGVIGLSDVTRAADLAVSPVPLFLGGSTPPNITVTLDDSGSMRRAFVPEVCGDTSNCDYLDNRYGKAAHNNALYYNPNVTYAPPKNADGTSRPSSSNMSSAFTTVYRNGFDTAFGTVNLSSAYRPTANLDLNGVATEAYMDHYRGTRYVVDDMLGTDSGSNAPYFDIPNFFNKDGSASGHDPNTNLISVTVAGTTYTDNGTLSADTCANTIDPTSSTQYKTRIIGTTLRLCFNDTSANYGKQVIVALKDVDPTAAEPATTTANVAAYYYNYDPSNGGNCTGTDAVKKETNSCYDFVTVSATSGPGGTDERQNFANWYAFYRTRNLATVSGASIAFAGLDPSYRVAWQALNTCRGSATSLVDTDCDGWKNNFSGKSNAINTFTGTHKTNFFDWLFQLPTNGGTPLREAMTRVGEYYKTSGENSPYDNNFSTSSSGEYSCRKNAHILMTDGIWNDSTTSIGNVDNTSATLPDGKSYAAADPYNDSYSNTLADVAFKYWSTDLRTLTNNVSPNFVDNSGGAAPTTKTLPSTWTNAQYVNPKNNPATWQHMVNYTIGLGLTDFLADAGLVWTGDMYAGSYPDIVANTAQWPDANLTMGSAGATYGQSAHDLWHAAINSRGRFFSVESPDALTQAFNDILSSITSDNASASSVALNSTSLRAGSSVYQARFDSNDWSGQLLSLPIAFGIPGVPDGTLLPEEWDAAVKLAGQNYDTGRRIVTFKPLAHTGAPFRWGALEIAQSTALNTNPSTGIPDVPTPLGSERLDYLRGKDVAGMRPRAKKLGDIVHSSPAFVGAPIFRYPDIWPSGAPENGAAAPYSMFKSNNKTRKPLVYAGANDGMLHAFDASTGPAAGEEVFAYVPAAVYKNLNQLTNPAYAHRFFVDGAPTVGDAFFDGSWHTVLIGGLRAGGQAIYALDITDPPGSSDDETGIAAKVLWEFNDIEGLLPSDPDYGDKDLGNTFSEPNIVRLHNGEWAAVFGNGYNNTAADGAASTTGNAVLYFVNIKTGELIKKIDTGVGKTQDPKNTLAANQRPNGLATPAPIDTNGDSIVDYIYAGDLFGNLWKFDVNSADKNQWQVLGPSGGPIFVACAGTGTQCTTAGASNLRQPITTRPQVGRHPTKANGFMVYFGTGKYFETGDNSQSGQTTQTFYGVWDENQSNPSTTLGRTNLLQQKILKEVSQGFDTNGDGTDDDFFDLRITSDDPINWDTPAFHRGWYMDLINTGESPLDNEGERQVTDSLLRDGRIIFTTLIPSADPCDFGGTGWLMEIDAKDGSRLEFSPFDLNADGEFDGDDHVKVGVDIDGDGDLDPVPPGGKKSKVGIPPTPGVVSDSSDPNKPPKELKYTSGSTGQIEATTENPGSGNVGRRSWRELQLQ